MTSNITWRKSSYSASNSACVEVADLGDAILVRNSNHPDAGTLHVAPAEMSALIEGVKAGELDR